MRHLLCMGLLLAGASSAAALGWGPRVGISSSPDQVFGGVHFDAGNLSPEVRFRPSVQAGIGDDAFTLAGNGAVHYVFDDFGGDWRPYAGAELGFIYVNVDLPDLPGSGNRDDSDTELGLSAAGGIERVLSSGSLLILELRIGFIDAQDLQFHIGWGF